MTRAGRNTLHNKLQVVCGGTVIVYLLTTGAGVAQSVKRLVTGCEVRGSNPTGGEIFRTHPDRPWGPPSLLYNEYRVSFPGVKRPERRVNNPPSYSAEVKERVERSSSPLMGLHGLL